MIITRQLVEITVDHKGAIEATLFQSGVPIAGHSDSTCTLAVNELARPLYTAAVDAAEAARDGRVRDAHGRTVDEQVGGDSTTH